MLHIILSIVKIILLLFAGLLGLLLFFIFLALFVPARYRMDLSVKDGADLSAGVTWLLRLVSARVCYHEKEMTVSVKFLGFSLIGGKKEKRRTREAEDEEWTFEEPDETAVEIPCEVRIRPAPTLEEQPVRAQEGQPETETKTEECYAPENSDWQEAPQRKKKESLAYRLKNAVGRFLKKIREAVRGLLGKLQTLSQRISDLKATLERCIRLWRDEHTQRAYRHARKELLYLLKHWFPRKIEGNVLFGLSDPAQTGQLLGILCMVQAFSGNRFYAEADFQEPKFEGTLFIKGHVRICHLLRAALALLFDKHVRITFRRVRKMRG